MSVQNMFLSRNKKEFSTYSSSVAPRSLFMLRLYGPVNPMGSCWEPSSGLVIDAVNQYYAHSLARNWQLPFLNQWKGENDLRKYFMIKSPRKTVADSVGVEPTTSWSPVGCASNWATEAGTPRSVHGAIWPPKIFEGPYNINNGAQVTQKINSFAYILCIEVPLIRTTPWANSADDKGDIFLFFPENWL